MKISYAVSFQETKFNFIASGDWIKKAGILSALGYDGIELSIRNPAEKNIAQVIEKVLKKTGLGLAAIGTGQMFVDNGLCLSAFNRDIRQEAINRIQKHLDLAKSFDSQVIIGLARGGRVSSLDTILSHKKTLKESFKKICDYADKKKVLITVEPINRYETSFFHTVKEVLSFIKGFNCSFLGILLDTFHANIEEKDFTAAILEAKKSLSHVHLADSNRLCPGMGHIDFKSIIAALKRTGYRGYLSAELMPYSGFSACAHKYLTNIRRLI